MKAQRCEHISKSVNLNLHTSIIYSSFTFKERVESVKVVCCWGDHRTFSCWLCEHTVPILVVSETLYFSWLSEIPLRNTNGNPDKCSTDFFFKKNFNSCMLITNKVRSVVLSTSCLQQRKAASLLHRKLWGKDSIFQDTALLQGFWGNTDWGVISLTLEITRFMLQCVGQLITALLI